MYRVYRVLAFRETSFLFSLMGLKRIIFSKISPYWVCEDIFWNIAITFRHPLKLNKGLSVELP